MLHIREMQREAVVSCFLENGGAEYVSGHWLYLINSRLPKTRRFANSKAFGKALSHFNHKDIVLEKRVLKLSIERQATAIVMYKVKVTTQQQEPKHMEVIYETKKNVVSA